MKSRKSVFIIFFILCTATLWQQTHIVKKGDTLWDLSEEYLKDPFQWPGVWEVNPHIKDAHWIYPGDEVHFSGQGANAAASSVKPNTTEKSMDFSQKVAGLGKTNKRAASSAGLKPPVSSPRHQDFTKSIRAEVINMAPYFAIPASAGKIFSNETPFTYKSQTGGEILQPFTKIAIPVGKSHGLRPGENYQIFEVGKSYYSFRSKKDLGKLVTIKGIVGIEQVDADKSTGILTECFGSISPKARVSPFTPHPAYTIRGYERYQDKSRQAQIVFIQSASTTTLPFTYAILDNGAEKGFKLGDGILIYNRDPVEEKPTDLILGKALVVKVSSRSATILIRDVYPGRLNTGDFAIAVHSSKLVEEG